MLPQTVYSPPSILRYYQRIVKQGSRPNWAFAAGNGYFLAPPGVQAFTVTGLPLYEKASGKGNVAMMMWADFGFDLYSLSIAASAKTMKERPKVLKDFLEASYMGWRDVMADQKAAMDIFKKRVPEIDYDTIAENMKMGLALMNTERYAKNGIGWMEEKKMCQSVDLVNTYMGVPTKVECKAVYTNDFLTKIELPKSMR